MGIVYTLLARKVRLEHFQNRFSQAFVDFDKSCMIILEASQIWPSFAYLDVRHKNKFQK